MPKLLLTVGLPGCGKTTFAAEYVKSKNNTVNINMDDMRQMMAVSHKNYRFNNSNEAFVQEVQKYAADNLVSKGKNIVVSDTNLNPKVFKKWEKFAKDNNYHFEVVNFFEMFKKNQEFEHEFFAVNAFVKQCKERNLLREKSVPEEIIDRMALDYLYPASDHVTYDPNLPECVIVDIDGTMAHMHNRSPYDESKVIDDIADAEVILSVIAEKEFLNRKVIVMSGRKDSCREDTEKWLKMYRVPYDELHMRAHKDSRGDEIVKYELFRDNVLGKYNAVKVFDDREKVCFMWRNLFGLKVYQVEPGKF